MKTGHRIDSPLHQNAKPLPNSDLLQATNNAYKVAYKQYQKVAANEVQKILDGYEEDDYEEIWDSRTILFLNQAALLIRYYPINPPELPGA